MLDGQEFTDGQTWTLGSNHCSTCTCQVWPLPSFTLRVCIPPVCLSANVSASCRQVKYSVRLLGVPSWNVCIRWLIQEPAVLAVEVNISLKSYTQLEIVQQGLIYLRFRLYVWSRGARRGQQLVRRLHALHDMYVCGRGHHLLWSTLSIPMYQLHQCAWGVLPCVCW